MKTVSHENLKSLITRLFSAAGCNAHEAERIAHYLVLSNLVGHDSHGVIRVSYYLDYIRTGTIACNQSMRIVFATDSLAVVDGNGGFGQVIGEQATQLGIEMAQRTGLSAIALRNSGHLGRIGDWPAMAAAAGLVSFHFVNTSGLGRLAAPFGGIDRRLSANPIAAGVPVSDGPDIIMDISTCAIAEGKLKVAKNAGKQVPAGCLINHDGEPTTNPNDFYADPPGAILPFGFHKGYGLSIIAEMFAGALTGSGCTNPEENDRLINGMFSLYIDPARLPREMEFSQEVQRFIDYVKSSRRVPGVNEILMPGEFEERTRSERTQHGIPLDDLTWQAIVDSCERVGIPRT
ncbi:MAG: malate/lactate/ureidoglycolate dehydrogenase, partial [Planctomycetaceae bacterium]|nr:malate/lactate/ureidoglycolate dehydrogenase [Planctomycetaceae bacterium]